MLLADQVQVHHFIKSRCWVQSLQVLLMHVFKSICEYNIFYMLQNLTDYMVIWEPNQGQ